MKTLQFWKYFSKTKLFEILEGYKNLLDNTVQKQWEQLKLHLFCFSTKLCYYLTFPFNLILTLHWLSRTRDNIVAWRNRQWISVPNQPFQLIFWGWITGKISIPSIGLLLVYKSAIEVFAYLPITLIAVTLNLLRLGFLSKYFYDPVEDVSIFTDNMLWKTFRHIYWDFKSDVQQDKTILEKGLESWDFISNFWGKQADKLKWTILWQIQPDFCCFLKLKLQKRDFEWMYNIYNDHRWSFSPRWLGDSNVLDRKHFNEYNYQVLITQKELLDGTFFYKTGTKEWGWNSQALRGFHPGFCYPYNPGFGYFPQQKNYAWVTQYLVLMEYQMLYILGEANFLKITDRSLLNNFEKYDYLKTIYNSIKQEQNFQEREDVLHKILNDRLSYLIFNDALNFQRGLGSFRDTISGWRDAQFYKILHDYGPVTGQFDNVSSKFKWNIIFHLNFEETLQTNSTNQAIEFKKTNI